MEPASSDTICSHSSIDLKQSVSPVLGYPSSACTITLLYPDASWGLQHTGTVDLQLQKRGMQGVRRLFCSAVALMLIDLVCGDRQIYASNVRPLAVGKLSSSKRDVTPTS